MSDGIDASNEPNPYQPPAVAEEGHPLPELGSAIAELSATIVTGGQRACRVQVYEDRLRIHCDDDRGYDILREDFPTKVRIIDGWLVGRCLEVPLQRRSVLQFSASDYERITAWMGPPSRVMLREVFKSRLRFAMPLGVLIVLSSMPLPGDPTAGLEPKPFSIFHFVLGTGLVTVFCLARYFPHRNWLLADASWFLLLAVTLGYDMLMEGWAWYWALLLVIYLSMVSGALVLFRRLGRMTGEVEWETATEELD